MIQSDFFHPKSNEYSFLDGKVVYIPSFLSEVDARNYFIKLMNEVQWRAEKIKLYGKEQDVPRLQAWYGDFGKSYTYSNIRLNPVPWIPTILELKQRIESHTKLIFNSVLLNYYRTGKDYVGWHADNEPELGKNPFIASLSLGGLRRFQIKHKFKKEFKSISIETEPGSLIIMLGSLQENWIHRIAPTKRKVQPRINLTFRKL